MIYPIGFSIPAEKIVCQVPPKQKLFAQLIPGFLNTYIYESEDDYRKDYQDSFFAYTWKKAGFDCLRHYEILANGCIPFFPDLGCCPPQTMELFPKDLVLQAMEHYCPHSSLNVSPSDAQQSIQKLLDYTRNHLTTEQSARRILQVTGHSDVCSVLFLSGQTTPDYMRCLTLHGFKCLLGKACHDVPRIPHLYTDFPAKEAKSLYGKGFTYTCLLDPSLHSLEWDSDILEHIRNHRFDVVVYGSVHRGLPYLDIVRQHYNPNEIIGICGEDHLNEQCSFVPPFEHFFLREWN
jgi:hypothetical protein